MVYKLFVNNCLIQKTESATNTATLFEYFRDYKHYITKDVIYNNDTTSYYFIAK